MGAPDLELAVTPKAPESLAVDRRLSDEGDSVFWVWESRFGRILMHMEGGLLHVNGEPVQPFQAGVVSQQGSLGAGNSQTG
jgi:hypothetical protein